MRGTLHRFWPHLLCAVVALGLWDTPVIKPFRVFMVMVHEMGHATAALATGGEVTEIRVLWNESGHSNSRGGWVWVISSAGYVGSALLGAFLIFTGSWVFLQRLLIAAIGCASIWLTVHYTPVMEIDFTFGVISGLVLLVAVVGFPRGARWVASWLGVMLCLYSLHDFRTDLWMHTEQTDAGILARYWGVPLLAYPIALVWALVSVYAMFLAMRAVERRGRKMETRNDQVAPDEMNTTLLKSAET
jgi:hypothetical protein